MKKWVSIVLLSLFLVSTTELYQLLKMPVLVEHFLEHKVKNRDITFIDFIKMHYNDPVKDADYTTDQKLPFVAHSLPLTLVFTINPEFIIEIKKHIPSDTDKKTFSEDHLFYNKDAVNSIWQPPKNC